MTYHFETSGSRKAADRSALSVTSGLLSVPEPVCLRPFERLGTQMMMIRTTLNIQRICRILSFE
jgi:hypothetical protein